MYPGHLKRLGFASSLFGLVHMLQLKEGFETHNVCSYQKSQISKIIEFVVISV